MPSLPEMLSDMAAFFEAGGPLLWAIFAVSLVLWFLIVERYLYLRTLYPRQLQEVLSAWRGRTDQSSWFAHKIRAAWAHQLGLRLNGPLALIRSLISVCPLLGLLGTVTGMISVFDTMAALGNSNPRAMATGISMATIPTMAGLVAALPAFFLSVRLRQRVRLEQQRILDLLRDYGGDPA